MLLVLATALVAAAPPPRTWTAAPRDYVWSFPRDHWPHPAYRTEWWYFTGILESEEMPRRRFGYQFTVFRIGITQAAHFDSIWSARQILMGHAAMGELDRGAHHFSEVFYREIPLLARFNAYPQTEIATSRAPAGTDGRWTLGWNGKGFDFSMSDSAQGTAFDLSTIPNRPLVLEGPNGYSAKNAAGSAASLYYSFPRMDTRGTLRVGGKTWKVRGDTWMDREFTSSSLGSGQVGWDWMGLRLEDGRDLMLYILRRSDGQVDFRNATLVDAAGRPRYLDPSQWSVHVLDTWKSPNTQAVYPSRWLVVVPQEGLRLEVVPEMPDQENRSRLLNNLYYWEGAARVRAPVGAGTDRPAGRTVGGGYVELTGYGKGSRVPR